MGKETANHMMKFERLRAKVHKQQEKHLKKRLDEGRGRPTDFELELDAYKEEIEPQVWPAVKKLKKKGYPTDSSGFYGKHSERQAIEGQFILDPHTVYQLYKMDVFVIPHPDPSVSGVSQIFFYPKRPHLKDMKKTWKKVAKSLPDLHREDNI